MILPRFIEKLEHHKEYFSNGDLRYECYTGTIRKGYEYKFDRRVTGKDGRSRVRLIHATKYRQNGDIEWKHIYDDYGEVIRKV